MTNPIRSPPSRPATQQGDVPYNTRDAALKGATLAFAKPPVKPKPKLEKLGGNGALMAATIADRTHSPRPTNPASPGGPAAPISRQDTGSSYRSNRSSVHISPYPQPGSTLNLPQPSPNARAMSPSNIAASLAAARHTPASSKQPQDLLSRSGSGNNVPHTSFAAAMKARGYDMGQDHDRKDIAGSRQGSPKPASPAANAAADDAPTPSASSLVRMFEMRNEGGGRKPAPPPLSEPLLQSPVSKPPILSPKPRRTISSSLTLDKDDTQPLGFMEEDEPKKKPVAPKPKPKELKLRRSTDKGEQAPFQLKPVLGSPSPKSRPQTSGSMVSAKAEISSPSSYASAPEYKPEPKEKPNLPPPRRSKKTSASTTQDTITAETAADSPKSSSARKPRPSVSVPRKMSVDSEPFTRPTSTPTSSYQRQSLAMIKPHMTGDSLANAMVGAALASRSRPTTPARGKSPPPLPHRSPYHHHHHHHHHPFHRSPSPSPAKRPGKLRTTMREDSSSSSSSDDKHKKTKKFFGKKHPNKHHEGSRKRWRDSITERERKRYEGVWAANRGLHLGGHLKSQDEVLNLVVRDIWRRSRLPDVVLEEVWELVDNSRTGRLKRDEFVVGLWLVDQSLKGRKLPTRVGESVWASVRSPGLKVKVK